MTLGPLHLPSHRLFVMFDGTDNLDHHFVMIDSVACHAEHTVQSIFDAHSDLLQASINHADILPCHRSAINRYVDDIADEMREISLYIHDHPELKYTEFLAHEVLTSYLRKQRFPATERQWQVTPSAYDIPTAFLAEYDSGLEGPVVSFNAEYDALKGLGHACGHNLIAIASLAGALATARIMEDNHIAGKVILFGTPAEEGGGGKIRLIEAGAYQDHRVDISLISHPGISDDAALVHTAAFSSLKVEYFGKEAHAAARPWDGVNALDALIIAYNAISVLRQQTQPGDIIEAQILNGGLRPNIIHAYSSGIFVVRSDTRLRRDALRARVVACLESGATATGATIKITHKNAYEDHVPNKVLGARYRHAFLALGGKIAIPEVDQITSRTSASTDQGNVSHVVPSISPNFWIRSTDDEGNQLGGPHTPDFEKASKTDEAQVLALRVAKALAATAIDVLTRPSILQAVKDEFNWSQKQEAECRAGVGRGTALSA